GLKRGFTFFHHDPGRETAGTSKATDRQLLVAASPNDTIADTHWFRGEFGRVLREQARGVGADYIDQCDVQSARREGGEWRLTCRAGGLDMEVRAKFVVDATGPRGLMYRMLGLKEAPLPKYPATSALYSHFTGVSRFPGAQHYADREPPYPPDAAALHHVFDGGWIWVLHFNNGWTSAGVAATAAVAERFCFAERDVAWRRLLDELPEVKEQFAAAQHQTPSTYVPRLSFRSSQIAGDGWAMLPSAAGFVDPLLSTGFPLTLLGLQRLAAILEPGLDDPDLDARLAAYAAQTDADLLAAARLIAALYATMDNFPAFTALTMLYFAAVSYSEAARRLGKPQLAASFLLHDHPRFGPAMRQLLDSAASIRTPEQAAHLVEQVRRAIEPINVTGLADPARHN